MREKGDEFGRYKVENEKFSISVETGLDTLWNYHNFWKCRLCLSFLWDRVCTRGAIVWGMEGQQCDYILSIFRIFSYKCHRRYCVAFLAYDPVFHYKTFCLHTSCNVTYDQWTHFTHTRSISFCLYVSMASHFSLWINFKLYLWCVQVHWVTTNALRSHYGWKKENYCWHRICQLTFSCGTIFHPRWNGGCCVRTFYWIWHKYIVEWHNDYITGIHRPFFSAFKMNDWIFDFATWH